MVASLFAFVITGLARAITGARALWRGCAPERVRRVYFANHGSHIDFVLIWSSLPPALRRMTRPVAGSDYWDRSGVRRFIIHQVFRGVLVNREHKPDSPDPIDVMVNAIDAGASLVVFPKARATSRRACCRSRAASTALRRRAPTSSSCRCGWTI